jgi:hypothetical protein
MTESPPALSRRLLSRVLGLSDDASRQQIEAATPRLLIGLLRRLPSASEVEAEALRQEIAELESSSTYFVAPAKPEAPGDGKIRRQRLLGALLVAALMLVFLSAYAAGFRVIRQGGLDPAIVLDEPAQLILDGRMPNATLSVLDADREEILLKTPAEGAQIELAAGRYALEIRREDCPDHWTRSVYFEAGTTHRYEPLLCVGEGQVTVRSNAPRDRLRIDGFDLGPTREEPHLLGVGDHEIRVEKEGFLPFVGRVRIRPDEALTLHAELVPESSSAPSTGRPMPVEKSSPSNAPPTAMSPELFDLPNLRKEFAPDPKDLALARENLLKDDDASHGSSDGGSTRWHDRFSAQLRSRYDTDQSGQIDRLEESEAISCEVWREIERDFDGGGLGLSMTRYYGFDGSEWHPDALGFSEAHRSAVFEKMKECGLQN